MELPLLSASQICYQAIVLIRSRLATLIGLMLISTAATIISQVVLSPGISLVGDSAVSTVLQVVVSILTFLLSTLVSVAVIRSFVEPIDRDIFDLLRSSSKQMLLLAGFNILYLLWASLGFLFFLVPGFVMIVWWNFGGLILILERTNIWKAFHKSRQLVSNRFWPVAGRLVVLALLLLLAFTILGGIGNFLPDRQLGLRLTLILVTFIYVPFSTAFNFILYLNLRTLHEPARKLTKTVRKRTKRKR